MEVRESMAKPVEERHWMMVIDTRKCVGCHACTIACIAENKLPPGVVYRPVLQEEIGTFPNVQLRFFPRPCMQCDNPPCVPVCPNYLGDNPRFTLSVHFFVRIADFSPVFTEFLRISAEVYIKHSKVKITLP